MIHKLYQLGSEWWPLLLGTAVFNCTFYLGRHIRRKPGFLAGKSLGLMMQAVTVLAIIYGALTRLNQEMPSAIQQSSINETKMLNFLAGLVIAGMVIWALLPKGLPKRIIQKLLGS